MPLPLPPNLGWGPWRLSGHERAKWSPPQMKHLLLEPLPLTAPNPRSRWRAAVAFFASDQVLVASAAICSAKRSACWASCSLASVSGSLGSSWTCALVSCHAWSQSCCVSCSTQYPFCHYHPTMTHPTVNPSSHLKPQSPRDSPGHASDHVGLVDDQAADHPTKSSKRG